MNQVLSKIKNDALAVLFMAAIGALVGTAAEAAQNNRAQKNAALFGAALQNFNQNGRPPYAE